MGARSQASLLSTLTQAGVVTELLRKEFTKKVVNDCSSNPGHMAEEDKTDATKRLQVVRIKRKRGDAAVEEISKISKLIRMHLLCLLLVLHHKPHLKLHHQLRCPAVLDALHVPSKLARVDGLAQLMAAATLAPTRAPTLISAQGAGVQEADEHSRSRRRFRRVHTLTADALKVTNPQKGSQEESFDVYQGSTRYCSAQGLLCAP